MSHYRGYDYKTTETHCFIPIFISSPGVLNYLLCCGFLWLGFLDPERCGSVFAVILLRLLDCDINLTGIFGNRPSLNPFIVPK